MFFSVRRSGGISESLTGVFQRKKVLQVWVIFNYNTYHNSVIINIYVIQQDTECFMIKFIHNIQ